MVEGSTNLFETVDRIILQIAFDEANLVGIGKSKSTMEARKKRIEGRVDTMRTMLASALEIIEEKRFERPLATITLKPTPRKVLITDEADIPERFWKQPDPVLSKKDLADALKEHEETLQGKLDEIKAAVEVGVINADQAKRTSNASAPPSRPSPAPSLWWRRHRPDQVFLGAYRGRTRSFVRQCRSRDGELRSRMVAGQEPRQARSAYRLQGNQRGRIRSGGSVLPGKEPLADERPALRVRFQ